jgi:hypothetical protein
LLGVQKIIGEIENKNGRTMEKSKREKRKEKEGKTRLAKKKKS